MHNGCPLAICSKVVRCQPKCTADAQDLSESNTPERRVYHLPLDLLERLRAYQSEQKIPSEVEAVRRLLNIALEMRDTVETILKQLQVRFVEEGDVRLLASEILPRHSLVTEVRFEDESVCF